MAAARSLGVTYIHPSDHDWRIDATNKRFNTVYDFASGLSGWLGWTTTATGSAGGTATIVTVSDSSPFAGKRALRLRVVGNGANATRGIRVTNTHTNLEGNVRGRRLAADVFIKAGVLEVAVVLSRHLGGMLTLRYRLGNVTSGNTRLSPTEYAVQIPAQIGRWVRFDLTPMTDAARLWPDLDAEDNSINGLEVTVRSAGATAEILLPRLELPRDTVGTAAVSMHQAMIQRVRNRTGMLIGNALEYSWDATLTHLNGFFPDRPAPLLPESHPYAHTEQYAARVAQAVHALGGVVSLNHPTGASVSTAPPSQQRATAKATARNLIQHGLYGVDVIELGYRARGGLGIEAFLLELGGMLWRDGWFYTANGVSDDHTGTAQHWLSQPAITQMWAPTSNLPAQLTALKAGRAHVTMWNAYRGKLWLSLNDQTMGSVQVVPTTSGNNQLLVAASELPSGATVTVYRGPVDYPGASVSGSGLVSVDSFPASAFAGGAVQLNVSRANSCYYLAVARSAGGNIVGFTNPVWELKQENGSRPIPADRRVS